MKQVKNIGLTVLASVIGLTSIFGSGSSTQVMMKHDFASQQVKTQVSSKNSSISGSKDVLYTNDGTTLDDFNYYGGLGQGTITIDNTVTLTGGNGHKAAIKDQKFTDFVYDVKVKANAIDGENLNGEAQTGVIFRASNFSNNQADGYNGYYFGLNVGQQTAVLGKVTNGRWSEIAKKKMKLELNKEYQLTIVASGNEFTCYVDYNGSNYAKVVATDNDHASGQVGIRQWFAKSTYKDFSVRGYEKEAQTGLTYTNSLLPKVADPDVMYYNGTYYLYPTNAGDANDDLGYKVYTSTDLINWTEQGYALKKGDTIGEKNFWAPDVIERDGTFYMYYTVDEHLAVATSQSPLGPFIQEESEWGYMHEGKEIDAHAFYDEASQSYYLYFVRFNDGTCADNGNYIWGAKLNDDMRTIDESTKKLLIAPGFNNWESNITEGPFMLVKDGTYYLTYSGDNFQSSNYGSAYATSNAPLGNFEKYSYNPIMQANAIAHGTGHHGIAPSPDGTEMFMVYHRHRDLQTTEPRELCIDRLQFTTNEDGQTVLEVEGPTTTSQKAPSGAVNVDNFIGVQKLDKIFEGLNGSSIDSWNLPEQVALYTSAKTVSDAHKANVTWEALDYDATNKAEQLVTIKGTITLPKGVSNIGQIALTTTEKVIIKAQGEDVVNRADLLASIAIVERLDKKQYTSESWQAVATALVNAKAVANDIHASQASVDEAMSILDKAAAALIIAPEPLYEKFEAENAVITSPARISDRFDSSGGKKVGYIENDGATVTFDLHVRNAGTYKVIAYAGSGSEMKNAGHAYYVNGDTSAKRVVDYEPNGWDNWKGYEIEVDLVAGDNTLTFTHAGRQESYSELDYIEFFRADPSLATIRVDGNALETFSTSVYDYFIEVEDLNKLPEISAALKTENDAFVNVEVQQATRSNDMAKVIVRSTDGAYVKEYRVHFYDANAFESSVQNFGADPYVTYENGYYYYVRVHNDYSLYVMRAKELSKVVSSQPHLVYTPSGNEPSNELWAPEIHHINGKWYIYYTAGSGASHRMYALSSTDPIGTYTFEGKLAPQTDKWGIDQTVLQYNGKLYAIWSGWEGDTDVRQDIYIAEMSDPTTIVGERLLLSKPEYGWETIGHPTVNEGAQIAISPNGIVNILYSASGSWTDDYCIGQLTLKEGGDPMNANDWVKHDQSVFSKNPPSTYSTGHASFTTSPDGKESYIVFHATKKSGAGWAGRGVRVQKFGWNDDGTPNFDAALPVDGKVNVPSGTTTSKRTRYEAEAAMYEGGITVASTDSLSRQKIQNIGTDGKVTFKVQAKKAGTYMLYVAAATRNTKAGFTLTIDGETYESSVVNWNANSIYECNDNWYNYEIEVELEAGEQTIVLTKGTFENDVDIDYLDVELRKERLPEVNKQALATLLEEANAIDINDLVNNQAAITFLMTLADANQVYLDVNASQAEVDGVYTRLQAAMQAIEKKPVETVNKELLAYAIEYAKAQIDAGNVDKLIDRVKAQFMQVYNDAVATYENTQATAEQVEQATFDLLDAIHLLDFVKADTTYLQNLVNIMSQVDTSGYYAQGVEIFNDALSYANGVLAITGGALESEVSEAISRLENAYRLLVAKPDKSMLESLIASANSKKAKEDYFESTSYERLMQALEAGVVVYNNENASSQDVNQAINTLRDALFNLRLKVDRAYLEELVKSIKASDLSKFTDASVATLMETVHNANAFLATPDKGMDLEMEDLAKLADAIVDARSKLELTKPDIKEGVTNKDDHSHASVAANGTVKSGDVTSIQTLYGAFTLALMTFVTVIYKRRKEKVK